MAQFARPSSDVATGAWVASTGSDFYALIDETSASDADYVYHPSSTAEDALEVMLSAVTDPSVHTGHTMRVRMANLNEASSDAYVTLKQGATTIKEFFVSSGDFSGASYTDLSLTLSEGEASAITNYSDLRFVFEKGNSTMQLGVSWAELEVPDVVSATVIPILLRHMEG